MMAALGTGATREGIVTVSLGTSGTVFAHSRRAVVDPRGEMAAFCDSTGGHLPLFCIQNCTNTTEIFKGILGFDDDALDAAARRAPPAAAAPYCCLSSAASGPRISRRDGGDRWDIQRRRAARDPRPPRDGGAHPRPRRLFGSAARARRRAGRGAPHRRRRAEPRVAPDVRRRLRRAGLHPRRRRGAALGAAIDALWCAAKAKNPRLTADAAAPAVRPRVARRRPRSQESRDLPRRARPQTRRDRPPLRRIPTFPAARRRPRPPMTLDPPTSVRAASPPLRRERLVASLAYAVPLAVSWLLPSATPPSRSPYCFHWR